MPRKKIPCPECGQPMAATSKTCRKCVVPYERTPEHCQAMSVRQLGVPKLKLRGRKRPKVGKKIQAWWTAERREAKRQEMAKFHSTRPNRGLTKRELAALAHKVGRCEHCGGDGSESRLDVHHQNRDRRDNRMENLTVLCHRCHIQEHALAGETGFHSMWRKRKMIRG